MEILATDRYALWLARAALGLVYIWFGMLKVLVVDSAAAPLVAQLQAKTIPFIAFEHFFIFLGLVEVLIGILWLIPGLERLALALLIPHMISTFGPLLLLPAITWEGYGVPTLEGQYSIKNVVLIALACLIVAWRRKERFRFH